MRARSRRPRYSSYVLDTTEKKRELLAAELQRYFGETCPALPTRWWAAIAGLAPPFLRELAKRLKELDAVTKETGRQLRVTLRPAVGGRTSTEPVLDHHWRHSNGSTKSLGQ